MQYLIKVLVEVRKKTIYSKVSDPDKGGFLKVQSSWLLKF